MRQLFFIFSIFYYSVNSQTVTVKIPVSVERDSISIEKAQMLYNKSFGVAFVFDDGMLIQFEEYYPLFKSHFFSDGTGNDISYTGGLALYSENPVIGWENVKIMALDGWEVLNHSFTHRNEDYDNSVKQMHSEIEKKLDGYNSTGFVVPANYHNYIDYAHQNGYYGVYTQKWGLPGSNYPVRDVKGVPLDESTDWWRNEIVTNNYQFALHRSGFNSNHELSIDLIDEIATAAFRDKLHYMTLISYHGELSVESMRNLLNHIEMNYGVGGLDNCWVASPRAMLDYAITRDKIDFNLSILPNEIEIIIDLKNIPQNIKHKAITFNLNGNFSFDHIEVIGTNNFSFKGNGDNKIINLNLENIYSVQPDTSSGIRLNKGWNNIGCPLLGETPIETALSSIWDKILVVKDSEKNYITNNPQSFNTLINLEYGKGYLVKVTENCILDW